MTVDESDTTETDRTSDSDSDNSSDTPAVTTRKPTTAKTAPATAATTKATTVKAGFDPVANLARQLLNRRRGGGGDTSSSSSNSDSGSDSHDSNYSSDDDRSESSEEEEQPKRPPIKQSGSLPRMSLPPHKATATTAYTSGDLSDSVSGVRILVSDDDSTERSSDSQADVRFVVCFCFIFVVSDVYHIYLFCCVLTFCFFCLFVCVFVSV